MDSDEDVPQLEEVEDSPASSPGAGPSRPLERKKVPLTLLTGYLGAGKSTLLEYVLTADHGYRIAVCMNDFGDTTDIESKSLTLRDPSTGEQTSSFLSLPNGCLCCSFKDMGIAAIEEMAVQQGVDWVMVELTGVADPVPIARSFWENEEMGDLVLDGVVCVVDSRNVLKQLAEERPGGEVNECQKQVACADVILLNKTDLVTKSVLHQVESTIRSINPTLRVFFTVRSRIPLEGMFNVRAYSSDVSDPPSFLSLSLSSSERSERFETQADPALAPASPQPRPPRRHSHGHSHSHAHPPHYDGITTALIPLPNLSPTQFDALNTFLDSTMSRTRSVTSGLGGDVNVDVPVPGPAPEILRTKGLFRRADGREYVLQGVTDLFEIKELHKKHPHPHRPDGRSTEPGEPAHEQHVEPKIVFIGKGVDHRLNESLHTWLNLHA
ncbi:hypothetical protein EHS25_010272 [Saitozyma podzolica]|uniref:CobW/HypB/UreG nucleotide-binding domain-containing protein n=1 Tax=Saitozyma podzolica TaxID=1890683 RepID=A0A427YJ34_9TREE|nr:hypothetical protein EHS25_010272 [Saitozyma podzolica]